MEGCLRGENAWSRWLHRIRNTVWHRNSTDSVSNSSTKTAVTFNTERKEAINRQAEYILNTYGNRILRLAYSYLHNMSDAEEVLQDTLLQFLKQAPVFESQSNEVGWLLWKAGNLSKNRIQYNRIRQTDELSHTLAAECREDLSFVWDAVKALPVREREAIHLFYCEGYSSAQIASILDRKESTVRSDLRRGRARLRVILKEEYDFEDGL